MMPRAEATGLGVAVVGHALLFAVLSLGLIVAPKTVPPLTQPVDIQIVDEVGLQDTVPNPSRQEPAPSVAPEVGPPVEPVVPEPTPVPPPKVAPAPAPPKPAPKVAKPVPTPKPAPKIFAPVAKPAPKAAPAGPPRPKLALDLSRPSAATPRGSRLGNDFLKGVSDRPTASTAQTPRAAAGPAVVAAIQREVYRQLKPFWKPPSGSDAELLITRLSVRLNFDGSLASVPEIIGQEGINDSNRSQARLHAERAIQAVRRAAPFNLPQDQYEAWKWLKPLKLYVGQPG